MKTSYERCHQEIAESLQRGEHIRCRCKAASGPGLINVEGICIIAYIFNPESALGRYLDINGFGYDIAYPMITETYVIDAVSLMKGLVERGYKVSEKGNWKLKDKVFYVNWWQLCGETEVVEECFEPWMLEEREVTE